MNNKKIHIIILVFVTILILLFSIKYYILPLLPPSLQGKLLWLGDTFYILLIALLAFIPLLQKRVKTINNSENDLLKYNRSISSEHPLSWDDYDIIRINKLRIPYLSFINNLNKVKSITSLKWDSIDIKLIQDKSFKREVEVPLNIEYQLECRNEARCRIDKSSIKKSFIGRKVNLNLIIQKAFYEDYLKTGEYLDYHIDHDLNTTLRSKYGSLKLINQETVFPKKLTNLCGVGIFLISSDNKIIVSKHSDNSHVYPERLTYSASGLMRYANYPHPFIELIRKTFQEIQHQINPDNVKMIDFGMDTHKLYLQISFYEKVNQNSIEIIKSHQDHLRASKEEKNDKKNDIIPRILEAHEFSLESVIKMLLQESWEPSAAAALLLICAKFFGVKTLIKKLKSEKELYKFESQDIFNLRSIRTNGLEDTSHRYLIKDEPNGIIKEVEELNRKMIDFMIDDIKNTNIVEFGCGTGSLSEKLINHAAQLTCVDLNDHVLKKNILRMKNLGFVIGQNNEYLKDNKKVQYIKKFAQEYISDPTNQHNVAVSSLLLIHNSDEQFERLIDKICVVPTVYVFEDITVERNTGPETYLRTKEIIIKAFKKRSYFYDSSKEKSEKIYDDTIGFFKFIRVT